MENTELFRLLYAHLEEREHNNIFQNLNKDEDYLEAAKSEAEYSEQYQRLDLSEEQREIIENWIDSILAQSAAHSRVVFRLAMQLGFSLLRELGDSE